MREEEIVPISSKTIYNISFICAAFNLRVKERNRSKNRMNDTYVLVDEKGREKTYRRSSFFEEVEKRRKVMRGDYTACATRDYDLFQ